MPEFTKLQRMALLMSCVLCFWAAVPSSGQARPATAEDAPPQIREMQAVENRWSGAIAARDQYTLELVLAPQFIGISSTGDVSTRDRQISSLFVQNAEPSSLELKVISVRSIGNVAIVNGTYVKHWKLEKGPMDEKGLFSHVFLRGRASWLCLNSQQTVVSEIGPAAAPLKQKSRSSNASLPLHIPLIYKGPASTKATPAPGANEPPS